MNKTAKILIIIVTWNKREYVLNLLRSVKQLDYPQEALDIVVVDNASTDNTTDSIRADFPEVTLLCNEENLGGTGGFNRGLAYAFEQPANRYDYLWLLDNDVQVNRGALKALCDILDQHTDIAIAGSTMMQMDYPWRINEMGAFVDRGTASLELHRYLQEVPAFKGKTVADLTNQPLDLSQQLMYCQPFMDVDYVAAASLLIRASVAREAGLWHDYFIHFDDVAWCLHIADMKHRIVVSAQSLIWHMSADTKVPDWVLYYDNRNALDLLKHHSRIENVERTRRYSLKKALYYALLGKSDLAQLHLDAIDDFDQGKLGKKDIALDKAYFSHQHLETIVSDPAVTKILLPWTVNLQASAIQACLVKAMKQRPQLQIDYLLPPANVKAQIQLPAAVKCFLPKFIIRRYWFYGQLYRQKYDVVMQSDYQAILPLAFIAPTIIYINYSNISVRKRINTVKLITIIKNIYRRWFQTRTK